jgi:hypothetical protein
MAQMNWFALARGFFLALCFSATAQAEYFVINVSDAKINYSTRTHFLVTSHGGDLSLLPQLVAVAKARKLHEAFPDEQVLIFAVKEHSGNVNFIKSQGFNSFRNDKSPLNVRRLVEEMAPFSKIASFHTFGHSAITEGIFLDFQGPVDIRWYPTDREPEKIKGHFTSDAYATLNGCNLGHSMAGILSEMWGIPISAALVGSHFEALYSDGRFYYAEGKTENYLARNSMDLFKDRIQCGEGCMRMRPDSSPYQGHYGIYRQGLPFYKFFCVGISEEKCLHGMAQSTFGILTPLTFTNLPTLEQYANVVREWLCPTNSFGESLTQRSCMERLERMTMQTIQANPGERTYSPFRGPTSQCDFRSCYSSPQCSTNPATTIECAKKSPPPSSSTTFVDEYLYYLKAYKYLGITAKP